MPAVRCLCVPAGSPWMGLKQSRPIAYSHVICSTQEPGNIHSFCILQRHSSVSQERCGFFGCCCFFFLCLMWKWQHYFLPCYMTVKARSKFATPWALVHFINLQVTFQKTSASSITQHGNRSWATTLSRVLLWPWQNDRVQEFCDLYGSHWLLFLPYTTLRHPVPSFRLKVCIVSALSVSSGNTILPPSWLTFAFPLITVLCVYLVLTKLPSVTIYFTKNSFSLFREQTQNSWPLSFLALLKPF